MAWAYLVGLALVLWGACGAVIALGRRLWSLDTTLRVHLIAVGLLADGWESAHSWSARQCIRPSSTTNISNINRLPADRATGRARRCPAIRPTAAHTFGPIASAGLKLRRFSRRGARRSNSKRRFSKVVFSVPLARRRQLEEIFSDLFERARRTPRIGEYPETDRGLALREYLDPIPHFRAEIKIYGTSTVR